MAPDHATTSGQAELKTRGVRPYPVPEEHTARYWAAAAEHRLVLPRCQCGVFRHPGDARCPACGDLAAEWIQVPGDGVVETFLVDHRNLVPGFDEPYAVAVVRIAGTGDRVRLVANVRGCPPEQVSIGMPVIVAFEELAPDVVLPQFVPREMGASRPAKARVAPDPVVLAKIRGKITAANVVATFAHHRELSNCFAPLFDLILNHGLTRRRQRELVILRTGWNCRSEYEFGQHTLFGREAGLTDAEIAALTRPLSSHPWPAEDLVLLRMADELHVDSCVTDATWTELAARWSPAEILELVASVLCYVAVSGILNSFGVELDEGVPGWPAQEPPP